MPWTGTRGRKMSYKEMLHLLLLCVAKVSIVGKIYRELIANVHEFYTCKTYKLFLRCLPVVVCDSSSLCLASALLHSYP